jgi:hypothetical protein
VYYLRVPCHSNPTTADWAGYDARRTWWRFPKELWKDGAPLR